MLHHHPSDNTLLEFSAGNLPSAVALCVSTHLSHCPECKNKVSEYNVLGGSFLKNTAKSEPVKFSFDQLMQRIEDDQNEADNALPQELSISKEKVKTAFENSNRVNEKVITKLLKSNEPLTWRKVSKSLHEAVLKTGQSSHEVCFHKIKKGGKVVEHDHKGVEITVVLEGSFSDESGTYKSGDYIEMQPGNIHKPRATQDSDCLCLTVVEAPVRLTGIVGKLVNPFISFTPR